MLTATTVYQSLAVHAATLAAQHLGELMMDADRASQLVLEFDDLTVDMSRQKLTGETSVCCCSLPKSVASPAAFQLCLRGSGSICQKIGLWCIWRSVRPRA